MCDSGNNIYIYISMCRILCKKFDKMGISLKIGNIKKNRFSFFSPPISALKNVLKYADDFLMFCGLVIMSPVQNVSTSTI